MTPKAYPTSDRHDRAIATISRENVESNALFLSIGEGAIVTDERGRVSRINEVALNILGLKADEIVGKWYPSVVVAEDTEGNVIPNIERPITEVFLTGKPIFKRVYYRCKDGSRIPVALTVSPVILNQQPIGAIEVFRDITEEVELENSKDEFISIASHQLRTPATIVKQYIGMMLEGFTGTFTTQQIKMLQTAYEHNEHQLQIINDLLKVAQADANKIVLTPKKTDIVKLLQEIVETQQQAYTQSQLKLNLTTKLIKVFCLIDPVQIRMVMENLLDNARKYTPPKKAVKVTLTSSRDDVIIRVKDEGVGIAAQDLPKLFQKFSRIDNPMSFAGGNGLGLYWAKKLVTLHNGALTVASEVGVGTIFTLTLPIGGMA